VEISGNLKIRRPPKELRDQARRDEIVEAARKCVVRHGFHAASMSEIAQTAGMSVGQIYRYFPNKEAIIHAIVARIVEQRLRWIATSSDSEDLPGLLAHRFIYGAEDESEDRILMLEVSAEASRNPAVANIAREADQMLRNQARATLCKDHPQLTVQQATAVVEFFAALAEGSALRRTTGLEPDKDDALVDLYRDVIASVFERGKRSA
jgi:AcrR family transcriptional regulator